MKSIDSYEGFHHAFRMRLLVSCPACKRQYDAGDLQTGDRFRCLCSQTLEVPLPAPHDAAVVRCSACGGPRLGDSARCSFCDADFTLHEQDLHTICPECMARVSDVARYCHHCATPLLPTGKAGEPSLTPCPVCSGAVHLTSRNFGQPSISVLECPRCAGLWLARETAQILLEKARSTPAAKQLTPPLGPARAVVSESRQDGARLYRPCPACGKLMHRMNFGRKSGVILDSCRSHGLWFDANELDAVLRWIRTGGETDANRRQSQLDGERERRAALERQLPALDPDWSTSTASSGSFLELLGWLVERIFAR